MATQCRTCGALERPLLWTPQRSPAARGRIPVCDVFANHLPAAGRGDLVPRGERTGRTAGCQM